MSTLNATQSQSLENRIASLEKKVDLLLNLLEAKEATENKSASFWMKEEEAMKELDLCQKSLRNLRNNNVIKSSTATGRKIKYWRKDVEAYLMNNSNVKKGTK